jgi:hypothetical protein
MRSPVVITKYEIATYPRTTVRVASMLEEKFQSAGIEVEGDRVEGGLIYLTTTHTADDISKALAGTYSPKYITPIEEVIL